MTHKKRCTSNQGLGDTATEHQSRGTRRDLQTIDHKGSVIAHPTAEAWRRETAAISQKTGDTDKLVVPERQDDVSTSLHPVTYFRLAWCKDETKNNCPSRHNTSCLIRRTRAPNVPINSRRALGKSRFPFSFSECQESHLPHVPFLSFSLSRLSHLIYLIYLIFLIFIMSLTLQLISSLISSHTLSFVSSPASFFISLSSFIFRLSCVSFSVCVHLHVGLLTVYRYETQTSTLQHGITRHSTASQLSSASTDMM